MEIFTKNQSFTDSVNTMEVKKTSACLRLASEMLPKCSRYALRTCLLLCLLAGLNVEAWGASATWTGTVSVASGKGTAKVEIYNDSDKKTESSQSSSNSSSKTATYNESTSFTHWYIRDHHFIFTATASTGYHFTTWKGSVTSTANPYETDKGTSSSTMNLQAYFEANSYTVNFDANGGSVGTGSKSVTYDATYGTLPTPTRAGYTFNGWFTETSGGTQVTASTTVKITSTQTLHAHWTAHTYTVTYDGNGNTGGSMSNQPFTYDVAQNLTANGFSRVYTVTYNAAGGECAETSADATYSFAGWEDRGSIIYNNKTYTYSEFDAPYYANTYGDLKNAFGYNKYSLISHYVNNGKGEGRSCKGDQPGLYPNGASVNNLSTESGATVTLYAKWNSTSVTLPNVTLANHVMEGWYDGNTKVGEPGDKYTPTDNVTLRANLTEKFDPEFGGSDHAMKVGDVLENAFTFNHTDNPVVHVSDETVISYSNNTVTALKEGTATLYFTQAGTSSLNPGESDHWTFSVTRYDNTLALTTTAETKYVGDEIVGVITDKNSDVAVETSSTDATIAYYDVANNKIVIPNSEAKSFNATEVTIKIWQAQNVKFNASGEKTITLTVNKYEPVYSLSDNELVIDETATLSLTHIDGAEVVAAPASVISYAAGTVTALAAGEATLTITQQETRTIAPKQQELAVKVIKKTPALSVQLGGQTRTSMTLGYNATATFGYTGKVSDAEVEVAQVDGAAFATYANGQFTTYYGAGTAHFKAVLPETDTYKRGEYPFSIQVNTPTGYLPISGKSYTIGSGSATDWTHKSETLHFNGVPNKLSFNFAYNFTPFEVFGTDLGTPTLKCPSGIARFVDDAKEGQGNVWLLYVEESADGNNWTKIWDDSNPSKSSVSSGEIQLSKTTRYIRFHHSSNFENTYSNITITELKYVEDPTPNALNLGTAAINAGEVSQQTLINWCNTAPLAVSSSNPRFSVSPTSFGNYLSSGSQMLTISYTHNNIVGANEGDVTITNGVFTKTIHVTAETTKYPQEIIWNDQLVATGFAMNVGEQYPDETVGFIAAVSRDSLVTYTSDNSEIVEVIDDTILVAKAVGTVNITARQAGDAEYQEVSATKQFVVTNLQKQTITWNQNLLTLLTTSGVVELNASATSGGDITYSSADENVVKVNGNKLTVVGEGETYITATQSGGEINEVEYLAISQQNNVIVRDPNSQCKSRALSVGSLELSSSKKSQDYSLSGIPETLTFKARHDTKTGTWGTAVAYSELIVEQYACVNNEWDWYKVFNQVVGTSDGSYTVAINETASKLRFRTNEPAKHTISTINVTNKKFMRTDATAVDMDIEANAIWSKKITVSHSNIDYMTVMSKMGLISLSLSTLGEGCGDFGDDDFTATFTPMQKYVHYYDTIVITDGKAQPTTITIPVHFYSKGLNQSILGFELPEACVATADNIKFSATASSELPIAYHSSDSAIAYVNADSVLVILSSGTVSITARQAGDNKYDMAEVTKTIVISKAETSVATAPTATEITYGQTLSDAVLNNGVGSVEGTFAWADGTKVLNAGAHTETVIFTPIDAAHYATSSTQVDVTVNKAASSAVAPVAVENLVYTGEAQTLIAAGSAEGGELQYSLDGENWSAELPKAVNAGAYAIYYKVAADANHNDFVAENPVAANIAKADASVTAPAAVENLVYNGEAQTLIAAGSAQGGELQYSLDGENWSTELPTAVEGGKYTVSYRVAGDANHNDIAAASLAVTIDYTIAYELADGNVETANPTHYNAETETFTLNNPAKEHYTFAGWTGSNGEEPQAEVTIAQGATGNRTYTANWTVNKYTITWLNADESLIEATEVEYGAMPEHADAEKAATAQYTYTFKGWTPALAAVTGNATYKAEFDSTVNVYTVIFKNGEEVLQSSQLAYGETPVYEGATPTKEADAQNTYAFAGWDADIAAVTGNATYTATFNSTVNKYTITWLNADESLIEATEVEYGAMPAHAAAEKAATAQYTYTFKGWTPALAAVTGNATYKAEFDSTVNVYTITFKNGEEVLQSSQLAYGETPVYEGATPTKEADAQNTYAFAGWDADIAAVTGNATYTAIFSSTVNKYTIAWLNADESLIEATEVEYGAMPAHADAEKAATAQYTYTFKGWTPALAAVTGNATYKAEFDSTVNVYTITFKNADGTELQKSQLAYGETPVYEGATPTKEADEQYTYTFATWTPEIAAVTGNATYTATFNSTVNKYTITWLNANESLIETTEVEYGATPAHAAAEKAATAQYTYTFKGWTPALAAVTGNATYKAEFDSVVNVYTVIFQNADGTELQKSQLAYGETPVYEGATPTKEADAQNTYAFAGWDAAIAAVTGNATYTATFSSTTNQYTITWLNADESLIDETEVEYGAMPAHTDAEKAATAQYTYTFKGWTPALAAVTGNATYKAEFDSVVNVYTVIFQNADGTELQKSQLAYGETPVYEGATPTKEADAQNTYAFAGWDADIAAVTGNATYTATFNSTVNKYTITWLNADESLIEATEVEYGAMPEHAAAEKAATAQYTYTFKGWTPALAAVTGNATYKAEFDSTVNVYTITFKNGEEVLQSSQLAYGETPVYEGATPTKEADAQNTYAFAGWDAAIAAVTGNATYTATFNSTVNKYTITWLNADESLIETTEVEYGAMPEHAAAEKAATAQYTYTFKGWTPALAAVTGNATYKAEFDSVVNVYTITFKNADGTELQKSQLAYGEIPVYEGATPTKEADEQYTYTFATWTPEIVAVTGEATYTATFNSQAKIVEKQNQIIVWEVESLGSIEVGDNTLYLDAYTAELAVYYTSSDSTIAYVDANNYVVALKPGEVTITARQDGNETYKAAEPVSKTLTVVAKENQGGHDATAVDETEAQPKAVKVLRGNQVFIIRGDRTYTAQGQLVN